MEQEDDSRSMITCSCGFRGHYYADQSHFRWTPQSCVIYLGKCVAALQMEIAELKKAKTT